MDPLSITSAVAALVGVCIKVGFALKDAHDGSQIADAQAQSLANDVESYVQVLRLMEATLEDEKVSAALQATGHIGNHWASIIGCIADSQQTLERLAALVRKVDRTVTVLDGARKHFRIKFAADEISMYRQQIRTYRDTMQLSIQTVILWNQVSHQASADHILPGLDDLTRSIRRLAVDLNQQMAQLRGLVASQATREQLESLQRMKSCVHTAADVVSSASTALSLDDKASVAAASDFGDIFPPRPSEAVIRWMSTVTEVEDESVSHSARSADQSSSVPPTDSSLGLDDSDSDGELELEIIELRLKQGRRELTKGNLADAERSLQAGLDRLVRNERRLANSEVRMRLLEALLEVHWANRAWASARDILVVRLQLLSRPGTASSPENKLIHLNDTLRLGRVLLWLGETEQARMYAKKCAKGYRRMGSEGCKGQKEALELLINICQVEGDLEGEDAYRLVLDDVVARNSLPTRQELPKATEIKAPPAMASRVSLAGTPPTAGLSPKDIRSANDKPSSDANVPVSSNPKAVPSTSITVPTLARRLPRTAAVISAAPTLPLLPPILGGNSLTAEIFYPDKFDGGPKLRPSSSLRASINVLAIGDNLQLESHLNLALSRMLVDPRGEWSLNKSSTASYSSASGSSCKSTIRHLEFHPHPKGGNSQWTRIHLGNNPVKVDVWLASAMFHLADQKKTAQDLKDFASHYGLMPDNTCILFYYEARPGGGRNSVVDDPQTRLLPMDLPDWPKVVAAMAKSSAVLNSSVHPFDALGHQIPARAFFKFNPSSHISVRTLLEYLVGQDWLLHQHRLPVLGFENGGIREAPVDWSEGSYLQLPVPAQKVQEAQEDQEDGSRKSWFVRRQGGIRGLLGVAPSKDSKPA